MDRDELLKAITQEWEAEDDLKAKLRVGKSAPGAEYPPGARITWKSIGGYGPYTAIVLGSELQASGLAYWCETAPDSAKTYQLGRQYWVYPREIRA